jgi:hypothetical protein
VVGRIVIQPSGKKFITFVPMKAFFTILIFTISFFLPGKVTTQYQGEIYFMVYNPASETNAGEAATMNLVFTTNRIFIDSNVSMNVLAGLSARGVLVRNDMQDFILITAENEGLKVAKTELESLVALMNRVQGRPDITQRPAFDWENKVTETGRARIILGKQSYEYILKGDEDGDYITVWLTDQIKVNWGLLLDAWYSTGTMQFDHEIPIEMVMNNSSFPLLVEAYKNGEVVFRAQAVSENSRNFNRSKTELSSGMKLLGLTELMMNFFRQQR